MTKFMANEVLTVASDASRLIDLQQRVLVPLELRLAEKWSGAVAPTATATMVLVALQDPARIRNPRQCAYRLGDVRLYRRRL